MAFVDAPYALALGAVPPLEDHGTTARVHGAGGRAVCEGVVAWRAGNPARAAQLLAPVRAEFWRLGGSHAQRDLFTLILLGSALQIGDKTLAAKVIAERAALRAGKLPPQLTLVKE